MKEKILWFVGGAVLIVALSLASGGIYMITPPNGPVDAAYKVNRFTGRVWLIKTYTKQVGPIRVLAARQADVEKTKEITEADVPPVAMTEAAQPPRNVRNR
ncbi:MAG: hypothetical protein HYU46_09965 [Deltaproteobacteria bacterium]|nr:hypothetical protein [Deltaproteobacteria bacterium]MBI2229407.1 hypothetical protein [Deltaproteobacteria bacterium]MBI2365595.1 hypothetical protein [Deltaproteobacteria bacterium]MBI2533735.1 hypothetical protein [Deltaproteobacteria bacterium]